MKLWRADIEFDVSGRHIKFSIIHNLQNVKGMDFYGALDCWLARTKNFTASSFCRYIMSKNESFVAMTEKQFNRLNGN